MPSSWETSTATMRNVPGQVTLGADSLAGEVDSNNYVVLNNPDIPTCPCSDSSPDVAFVPSSNALSFDWSALTMLNSDHLPILLSFADETMPPRSGRRFTSFRKAKWEEFTQESEDLFSRLPPPSSCAAGEKEWRMSCNNVRPIMFLRVFTEFSRRASIRLLPLSSLSGTRCAARTPTRRN